MPEEPYGSSLLPLKQRTVNFRRKRPKCLKSPSLPTQLGKYVAARDGLEIRILHLFHSGPFKSNALAVFELILSLGCPGIVWNLP